MKYGLREVIFTVLLLAIPAGAWWFVFRPNNARAAEMLQQIDAKREKLKALNHATATIGDLKRKIASLKAAIGFLQSRLPDEQEIDKVLQETWKLAELNQLKTRSIRTLAWREDRAFTATGASQAELPIEVQLEGDFVGFYTFLQALENQPRIMRIRRVKLARSKKAPIGHVLATFEMSIFFERNTAGKKWSTKNPT